MVRTLVMLIFGAGAVAGLTSAFFAYIGRTLRMERDGEIRTVSHGRKRYPARKENEIARPVDTYTEEDFKRIAAAVGKAEADVKARKKDFENAALMSGWTVDFLQTSCVPATQHRPNCAAKWSGSQRAPVVS